jgi:transcriptional antiterminator RfaH
MPILVDNGNIYPDHLLEEMNGQSPDRRWWVLYTKARQETALARELLGYRIPFYLPLVRTTCVLGGNGIGSHIPLFAGCVFLYGSEEERVRSLTTARLSRILAVLDGDRLRHDLRQVQKLIVSNVPLSVESRLAPGSRARVWCGPLAGLEGTVLVRGGRTRLLVSVDFLRQGASVEIDEFQLEPIG